MNKLAEYQHAAFLARNPVGPVHLYLRFVRKTVTNIFHQADLSLWTCERKVDFGVFTNQMILVILTLNYFFTNSKTFIAGKSYLCRIRFWHFLVVNPTLYSLS